MITLPLRAESRWVVPVAMIGRDRFTAVTNHLSHIVIIGFSRLYVSHSWRYTIPLRLIGSARPQTGAQPFYETESSVTIPASLANDLAWYSALFSDPMALRPERRAATAVEPDPMNGSTIVSPGLL